MSDPAIKVQIARRVTNVALTQGTPVKIAFGAKQGPKGKDGIDGSGDKNFVFVQGVPAMSWTIIHNLNKYPSVWILDSAGTAVEGDIHYDNVNQVTVNFTAAFSGKATLN